MEQRTWFSEDRSAKVAKKGYDTATGSCAIVALVILAGEVGGAPETRRMVLGLMLLYP
jgi:hypothetical protein